MEKTLSKQAKDSKITIKWLETNGWYRIEEDDNRAWQHIKSGVCLNDECGWRISSFVDDNVSVDILVDTPDEISKGIERISKMIEMAEQGQI